MTERVHLNPQLIYSVGTQIVALRDVVGTGGRVLHPRGSVGVVVRSPGDLDHAYRVRFLDGVDDGILLESVRMHSELESEFLGWRNGFGEGWDGQCKG